MKLFSMYESEPFHVTRFRGIHLCLIELMEVSGQRING